MGDDKAAIAELIGEYSASLNAGDIDRWLAIWDEEAIQMPPDERPVFGREKLRERNGKYLDKYHFAMAIDIQEIHVFDGWAYSRVFYTATLTRKEPGDDAFLDGKALAIHKRQDDGSWRLYRDCFSYNVPQSSG
jgi:uncharacterized protein (TIGR02246 family)